jgi:phospho-N-acetylmuramoyl-pentapeptide-transferase
MLYHLLYPLSGYYSPFNVFRYITFRTGGAIITAFIIVFFMGPYVIKQMRIFSMKQTIRDDGPGRHLKKEGTPTMGGVLILGSVIITSLIWGNFDNLYMLISIFTISSFGILGFLDDYLKVIKKDSKGLRGKYKLILQILFSLIIALVLTIFVSGDTNFSKLQVPIFKVIVPDLGILYIIFIIFVIVSSSNAVNLTDGLDGLAIGPIVIAFSTFGILTYVSGRFNTAMYLNIFFVKSVGEITVFCGAIVGAGLGFLWYNSYPAEIFMGDTGSLSLGASLGTVAVLSKHELLLPIIGGLFVIVTISVVLQVLSYKLRKKRIFLMAPLHHHFELKGWEEPKITVRFWIISIVLSLLAIMTLKLR